ncbi:isochorismatase family protein [Kineococcus sp. TBRC 1896]|uniref:Isochorismatase family protein n=1 Tax=Kineococcus mangrovi TaxID=1660183 RepID=A0ABV4I464_9ACTN
MSGLPRVAQYPLPTIEDLPAPRVPWRVDAERAVLLVHDLQEHFLRPFDRVGTPCAPMLRAVADLVAAARSREVPVVYSAQPAVQSATDRALLQDFWGPGLGAAPAAAARIVDEVAPAAGDVVLTKHRYSALVRTELLDLVRAAGRDQLVVTGVYTSIGCWATALHAFMEDVQPFVVADATADFDAADHVAALDHVARRCGRVVTAGDVLAAFAAGGRGRAARAGGEER